MAEYRLSKRADNDLAEIAGYTIEKFGIEQARHYRDALEICFSTLAENPGLGRNADQYAPALRRFEHQSHVVFYVPDSQGVLIARILHVCMDVARHL